MTDDDDILQEMNKDEDKDHDDSSTDDTEDDDDSSADDSEDDSEDDDAKDDDIEDQKVDEDHAIPQAPVMSERYVQYGGLVHDLVEDNVVKCPQCKFVTRMGAFGMEEHVERVHAQKEVNFDNYI